MAAIEVDSLISKLQYEADASVIAEANDAIDGLDVANKKAAASTDLLSTETKALAQQVEILDTKAQQLRDAQLALNREIGDTKPTKEQRQQLAALRRELAEVSNETRKTKGDLSQLSKAEKQSAGAAKEAASAKKQLTRAVAQAQRGMKDAATEAKGLGGSLETLALGGLLAAGAQQALGLFTSLAGKVFDTSVQFQKLRASLTTVTGSAGEADIAFDKITTFAAETPFQVAEISTAFIKLSAMGLDPSERALRSYGNTASAMGKDLNQMVEAVADAATGEFERLKEFGIKAKSQGDNVSLTFRGTTTTIKKDAESIQEYLLGIGETDFAGAMSMQMKTLGGQLSNLEDRTEAFFLKIGELGPAESFGEILGQLAERLTDETAGALAEVTDEGVGVFQQALDEFDAETIEGIMHALVVLAKLLAIALKLLIEVAGFFGRQLAFLGDALDNVGDAFDVVGDKIDSVTSGAETLGDAFDAVTDALFGVEDQAKAAEGALLSLVSGAALKKAEEIGAKIKAFGQAKITGATDDQLKALSGSTAPAVAEAAQMEIQSREQAAEESKQAELAGLVGGDKFKPDAMKKAEKAINDEAQSAGDDAFEQMVGAGMPADEAKKRATLVAGEHKKGLLDTFNRTGAAPKGKKKGKAKAAKQTPFEKKIYGEIDKLAAQAGERAGAEATIRAQQSGGSGVDAFAEAESVRKSTRDRLLDNFSRTGALPPGMQADLRQLQKLPNVQESLGAVAPPVISVTNIKVDLAVGEVSVGEGGTFAGSAREIAREINSAVDSRLGMHVGEAIANLTPAEIR